MCLPVRRELKLFVGSCPFNVDRCSHVPSRSEGIETKTMLRISSFNISLVHMCLPVRRELKHSLIAGKRDSAIWGSHVPSRSEGIETHIMDEAFQCPFKVHMCLPVRRELKLNIYPIFDFWVSGSPVPSRSEGIETPQVILTLLHRKEKGSARLVRNPMCFRLVVGKCVFSIEHGCGDATC